MSNLFNNISENFIIEPLNIGQGITIGNSLRRILLSEISSFCITGIRINKIKHEYSTIQGIKEDILEVLLNVKDVVLKSSLSVLNDKNLFKFKAYINVKGPCVVTAGMINLPKFLLYILNPNQYICTIFDDSEFYFEFDIEKGFTNNSMNYNYDTELFTIKLDTIFNPVRNVNFSIKLIVDSIGNIKESLHINIKTNGSVTPYYCLQKSTQVLIEMIFSLLFNINIIKCK